MIEQKKEHILLQSERIIIYIESILMYVAKCDGWERCYIAGGGSANINMFLMDIFLKRVIQFPRTPIEKWIPSQSKNKLVNDKFYIHKYIYIQDRLSQQNLFGVEETNLKKIHKFFTAQKCRAL